MRLLRALVLVCWLPVIAGPVGCGSGSPSSEPEPDCCWMSGTISTPGASLAGEAFRLYIDVDAVFDNGNHVRSLDGVLAGGATDYVVNVTFLPSAMYYVYVRLPNRPLSQAHSSFYGQDPCLGTPPAAPNARVQLGAVLDIAVCDPDGCRLSGTVTQELANLEGSPYRLYVDLDGDPDNANHVKLLTGTFQDGPLAYVVDVSDIPGGYYYLYMMAASPGDTDWYHCGYYGQNPCWVTPPAEANALVTCGSVLDFEICD